MASDHQEKQPKKLEHGVRDMVTAIMGRIPDLHHKPGSSSHHHDHDDERGVRVVTLAGNNVGASLKTDQPDHEKSGFVRPDGVFFREEDGESDAMNTYVNSNFQAINNSIMMGGKYEANDPGVHLDIMDVVESNIKGKFHKHGKKGNVKKKNKKVMNNKEKAKEEESSSTSDDDESESSSDGKKVREQKDRKMGPKKEGEPVQQRVVVP